MRFTREQAVVAASAPVMLAGLAAMALAEGWAVRLGGAAMVAGASVALAATGQRVRRMAWTLVALGALAVLAGWL
ncbi:MAG: hypothetical protein JWP50_2892 [Phenylobacterium sp.]|nr:hypothetical protein [Phenylobacterium sp.]